MASTLNGFVKALAEVRQLSIGRTNPVELEENPITAKEMASTIDNIRRAVGDGDLDIDFWLAILDVDEG